MLGIWYALSALGTYLLLAVVVYPALKHVTLWSLPAGTWLLLLACVVFLLQALDYIGRVERQEASPASGAGKEGRECNR